MAYLIRDQKTKAIIYDTPSPVNKKLKGKDIYPEFNSKTMELLKYDGENPPEHFKVKKNGFIVEKTLPELAKEGLIRFGNQLKKYVEYQPAMDEPGVDKTYSHMVRLGLKHKLIKTVQQCQQAFSMLDDEFEARVARLYRPGMEAKILKDYIEWMEEGKPAGDKREKKYLDMKAAVDALKDEYKEVRAALKAIVIPLKEQSA